MIIQLNSVLKICLENNTVWYYHAFGIILQECERLECSWLTTQNNGPFAGPAVCFAGAGFAPSRWDNIFYPAKVFLYTTDSVLQHRGKEGIGAFPLKGSSTLM